VLRLFIPYPHYSHWLLVAALLLWLSLFRRKREESVEHDELFVWLFCQVAIAILSPVRLATNDIRH
jgi:hypothetical protein